MFAENPETTETTPNSQPPVDSSAPNLLAQFAAAADMALKDPEVKRIGEASEKQLEAWKAEHKEINVFVVPSEDGKEVSLMYLKPLDRRVLALLIEHEASKNIQYELLMQNLWLGGDPRFQSREPADLPLQAAAMMYLPPQLVQVRYGMLKKH